MKRVFCDFLRIPTVLCMLKPLRLIAIAILGGVRIFRAAIRISLGGIE